MWPKCIIFPYFPKINFGNMKVNKYSSFSACLWLLLYRRKSTTANRDTNGAAMNDVKVLLR